MNLDEQGYIINPNTMYTKFKNLLKALNLPNVRFHNLRHSYASIMIEEKVPLKQCLICLVIPISQRQQIYTVIC
jgi:integrase